MADYQRVLEEREVIRVGGTQILPVDVRIISATNKNLEKMVRGGSFREDLYYRIRVLPLPIPSLRERREDIAFILEHWGFFEKAKGLGPEILDLLLHYDWPGNVRELKSITEYLTILSRQEGISPATIRKVLLRQLQQAEDAGDLPSGNQPAPAAWGISSPLRPDGRDREILRQIAHLKNLNLPAGRNALLARPELQSLGLTESNLRTRLKNLAQGGYVRMGKTRQGTFLTAKGESLLRQGGM